ncbi:MAG TPA: helix-turn-helix domain-containing protein [Rubrobacteraceae bacterium]|jgi:predicted ArsR family transcriptional regulator|nr:helix-turn-helix domain-containing protein [Rubrobacteraceae bacterium]
MYWDQKFFKSTRGQIVTLLRRAARTVEELAQALDLTDNGVRVHLATLERDGIVRQRGSVRRTSGGGKPAYIYELTPEAEELFAKAYGSVLSQLLDVLAVQLGPQESEALLRSVGRRIAEGQTAPADGVLGRLEAAVGVLNKLGGLAELEERDGSFVIRSYSCPLAGVAPDHPEVCRMAETLLTELAGVPVYEHCDRSERPRCCFEVAVDGDAMRE